MSNPSTPTDAVQAMQVDWAIVAPLMGGTTAMRAAGKALLPQYPAEEDETYKARLSVSTLLPAYSETVANMTSRVFAKPLQVLEDVPEAIAALLADVDLNGNDLSNWAVEFFRTGLAYGLCHTFVEVPRAEGLRTKADEKAAGIRPYLVMVKPEQVLGWRYEGNRLVQVRFVESVEEQADEFTAGKVQQIRVLEPGSWRVFRANDNGQWALHEEGATSLTEIPWTTFYAGRTGRMTARPPLLELAHMNVKHWQSQSDQDNLLHIARVPLLFMFTDDEDFTLTISAGKATRMPAGGEAKYVEHTGAAIDAGRQSLQDLVDEMRMAGAKLLKKDQQASKTAAQANEEAAQELSPLARMAGHCADTIAVLLQRMADYLGLPEGGRVEIRGNFEADYAPEVSLPALVAMTNAGKLSNETLYTEMQRRGVIAAGSDWEAEKARIEEQGPALGDA